jgi:hypothetical protein
MHLVDNYARTTMLRIGNPSIPDKFYPFSEDRYIVFCLDVDVKAKLYPYYQDVISMIRSKSNIPIVQVGSSEGEALRVDYDLRGKLHPLQKYHILKNAILGVGNDGYWHHVCSSAGRNTITVYGLSSPKVSGPVFGGKSIAVEPNRKLYPASMTTDDHCIFSIGPEIVANKVLDALGLSSFIFETLAIGGAYNQRVFEFLPNEIIPKDFYPDDVLVCRADYLYNLDGIEANISNRKISIYSKSSIPVELLLKYRNNLSSLRFFVSDARHVHYFDSLKKSGIPFEVVCDNNDVDISALRYSYYGVASIYLVDEVALPTIIPDERSTYYRTKKFILSCGNLYGSKSCLDSNRVYDVKEDRGTLSIDKRDRDYIKNMLIFKV